MIHLPLILNPKTLDPRDKNSPSVYQIESAMGAAISLFDGATAVNVPANPILSRQNLQRSAGGSFRLFCIC